VIPIPQSNTTVDVSETILCLVIISLLLLLLIVASTAALILRRKVRRLDFQLERIETRTMNQLHESADMGFRSLGESDILDDNFVLHEGDDVQTPLLQEPSDLHEKFDQVDEIKVIYNAKK